MKTLIRVALLVLTLLSVARPALGQIPPTPPRNQWFAENDTGHWSDGTRVRIDKSCLGLPKSQQVDCSLEVFKRRPLVVIAFVDTGINPYHQDFRAPEFVHHPSKYIEGFPKSASAFNPSFDKADVKGYEAARIADLARWSGVQPNELYWFPGTRIIGGISVGSGGTTAPWNEIRILDDQGHGTGVASVAAGQYFGSNPNALIVAVESLGDASLEWATSQKWIDIVSNSWGNIANAPLGSVEATREGTSRGQTVAFAAGNGATNTNSSTIFPPDGPIPDPCKCKTPDSNPTLTSQYHASWVLTVGAISPINGQAHWWHSIPVDVSSFGSKWRAAGAFGVQIKPKDEENIETRDFGGTSCATPVTAGVLSSLIEKARDLFNDTIAGQKADQVVAKAGPGASIPSKGPLKDGKLTRLEAEAIVQKTAFPVGVDPEKITWDYAVRPTTSVYFVYQGYGVVYRKSKELAHKVLVGQKPLPERPEVDSWIEAMDEIRDLLWDH